MDHNGFREFINRHSWTFARTYAAFCPHEYIVMKKQPVEDWPLFPEIAQFIRDNGFVAEYGHLGPNWYYTVDEYYYWTMDPKVENTDLINRAKLSDFEFVEINGKLIVRRNNGITNDELKKLKDRLRAVPDTYDDFVIGIATFVRSYPEIMGKLEKYLADNPTADSSDIIEFISVAAGY